MYKDGSFYLNSITEKNMSHLFNRASLISEQRICELSELADDAADAAKAMISDGCSIYEVISVISEALGGIERKNNQRMILRDSLFDAKTVFSASDVYDRAVFSKLFIEHASLLGISVTEREFFDTERSDENIIYVKNALADEAYDVFAEELSDPRVKYAKNFREACLAVSEGECEFCLLPLEERGGARLAVIADLIFRYDLKIFSITPVFGLDGTADMKYALLSKHFSVPDISEGDDRYLEITYKSAFDVSASGVLFSAELLGYGIYRINTVYTEADGEREKLYSIVFSAEEGKDFSLLLTFLSQLSGAYNVIGIYKNLE